MRDLTPRAYLGVFYPLVVRRKPKRAVVLMGPRRVGKTVMLHHAIQRLISEGHSPQAICYFAVDNPVYNGLSLEDLMGLFLEATEHAETDETFVFFDEIQYLRDWELHLKSLVDSYDGPRFIASGSAAAALRMKSRESGAGRLTDFLLPPLTFHEFLMLQDSLGLVEVKDPVGDEMEATDIDGLNEAFVRYLNFGGYPEAVLSPEIQADPARFIKSDIIDKVLLRDLPSLYGIQDIQELNSLFTTLAYNTGTEVSLDALSKKSGVAKNTIKRYVEYLEAAFLIKVVHRVDRDGRRFKRANFFKVYLTNPSIRCALFAPISEDDEQIGALVETAVYSQWFQDERELHYARWQGGEVDIVSLDPPWAVEVKWSDRFFDQPDDLRSLIAFCVKNRIQSPSVTTRTKHGVQHTQSVEVEFLPASLYCFQVGYNLVRYKVAEGRTTRRPR